MNEHLLTAVKINKVFENKQRHFTALKDIGLNIGNHEFVSLLGPSGCGKSTFLRLVAGLDKATSGTMKMNGQTIEKPGRNRGVVFQQYSLLPWLLAWQNVAFALKKEKDMSNTEKKDLAYHFLDLVGLKGFEEIYPSQMSGGMQQRVAIARALVIKPPLLLMDEPFGALDAQTRRDMQDLLVSIFKETRSSVLFVTHDVDEAVYLSDRVYVMSANPGRIAKQIDIHLSDEKDWSIQLSEPFINYKKEILMELKRQRDDMRPSE
ncbi:ABC transporter ATP-binding protein [Sporolactobacillus terrae]|uniref:ABC transporter ATP-binding protein n=1 Tax=Sporolactobacillus terrae TaxID=269673 RepID=A0ABX5Q3W8_9BACL|nr:ABC transporter ATP-binding protein [Sporolactobacillus terrae]QAA21338.1 ABC transporter ATP-binding protein [Sporolactobacillus terrae]QAA24310.1 ABC transporter ATP-binding protein [Sporolactobacillus terrae]UAK16131.1 ABC transporter ATP-binding protein [Sporolactobacillus terrae]